MRKKGCDMTYFCLFKCSPTKWHALFSVRFSAPWQCDMTYFLPVSVPPRQCDMTYFLTVSVPPDNVTWHIFCPFQYPQTMWHDLFSVRFSTPRQCDMTYFLYVFLSPDYVMTYFLSVLVPRFSAPWQCDMNFFLSVSLTADNVTWPTFCLLQCPLTMLGCSGLHPSDFHSRIHPLYILFW